jgi:hypothetical protein
MKARELREILADVDDDVEIDLQVDGKPRTIERVYVWGTVMETGEKAEVCAYDAEVKDE